MKIREKYCQVDFCIVSDLYKNVPYPKNTAHMCIYNNVYVYIYIYMSVLSHFKSRYQCHANIKGVFLQFEVDFVENSIHRSLRKFDNFDGQC